MRAIRLAVAAVLTVLLANPAAAVLVPYEGKGGAAGTTTSTDPGGIRPRGNNFVDVSPSGACGFTIDGTGQAVMTGCRNRTGALCAAGESCDLERVPAGRCTLGNNAACLWPNGAGFCTLDGNVGCLTNAQCDPDGAGPINFGTCDTSVCPGGDCSGCACQGTDDSLTTFESNVARCGGSIGLCSDGDTEFSFAPSLSAGLCSFINIAGSVPTNCGREAGQEWTGMRSGFHNPPLTPTLQREPGLGATNGPIVDLSVTQVYDIGAVEPGRGGVRRFSLQADSYWADPPWSDKTLTGGAANSHIWTLWCDTPANWSTDDLLDIDMNGTPETSCWNATSDSIGYIWTQNIPTNDYLPAGSATTNLDYDMNGVADCPPHCGVDYDIHTLEQLALEAVIRLDTRAGAQLALDAYVGTRAGAGDLVAVASVVSNVWLPALDQRCFMGGDPEAVCSTCVDGPDPDALPDRCSNYPDLSCTTNIDCARYTGRCSDSEQPCDPAGAGTACPGAQICRACVGNFAVGLCVTGGGACRLDSDCGAGDECGDVNGDPIYPEALAANPLAIPIGYNTYGFEELELETVCTTTPIRIGRLGVVTNFPRALGVPLAVLSTTGKAAAEVRDPDLGGLVATNDNARLGLVRGRCNGNNTIRCSTNADCVAFGGTCNNAPVVGIADTGRCNGNAAIRCASNGECTAYGGTCNAVSAPLDGGSYAVGTVFPVDPTGPACCVHPVTGLASTGNVTNTWDKTTEVIRPVITANAGAITWLQGNGSEIDTTAGSGTAGPFGLLRSGGWGPGANGTPGCPGDSSGVDALGAFPDQGPCNDPIGIVAQGLCGGLDCEGNTGADDVRTLATIGGVPNIHAIIARAKLPDPTAVAPTLYSVANLTGADLDALNPQDTDFSATVEGIACPMIGDCSQAGVQDCILDSDCGAGNTCQNRVARCQNPFVVDTDMDGVPDGTDNCPNTANPTQANFDGDMNGDACDACETVVNLGTDTDADGVDNACDTCLNQANPPVAGAPTTNRTFVSHQRDDDADGRGNRCDFDYNNAGVSVAANDFNDMKFSLVPSAGLVTQNTCGGTVAEGGTGATQQCGEFDHDGAGLSVTTTDFNMTKAALALGGLINTNFPKCTACAVGTGWSNTIGSGGERVGRPVCQTAVAGRCVFAP
jgi:hypothetical protein